jgi:hypothetical protein
MWMKKSLFIVAALMALIGSGCADLQKILENNAASIPLTEADIVQGLREALEKGAGQSTTLLSVKDGFYKSAYRIALPEEARVVTDRLKIVPGFTEVENVLVERINRAAEDAAGKALPIFTNAIRRMSVTDGMGILMGADDAATQYLNRQTHQELYSAFQPVILESLNRFQVVSYWEDAVNAYNKIPLVKKANPRLDDYVTQQALNALFDLVKKEEYQIRRDIKSRTSELLRRVFSRQDANRP